MATSDPLELAAEIAAAFVSHNSLPVAQLPALIESLHAAVKGFPGPGEFDATTIDPPSPAVSIRESVTPDYLICLEDGKRFKSIRRHLGLLGMTPEQYREKWGLPPTYPMVAPNFAAQRSAMAKSDRLGQSRAKHVAPAPVAKAKVVAGPSSVTAKRKLGRPRKTTR